MVRDKIFEAQEAAWSKLFTARHSWAVPMLHPLVPQKYREAAQAYRDLADVLDAYALEFPVPAEVAP